MVFDGEGYIDPELQDFDITDIAKGDLMRASESFDVKYLSPARDFPSTLPVEGYILGIYKRAFVNLVCCQRQENAVAINATFIIVLFRLTLTCRMMS
jgi:hypothetical protein